MIFTLYLNDSESYHLDDLYSIATNLQMFLNNYRYAQSRFDHISITISISSALSISVLFILLIHLENGAHFLIVIQSASDVLWMSNGHLYEV